MIRKDFKLRPVGRVCRQNSALNRLNILPDDLLNILPET